MRKFRILTFLVILAQTVFGQTWKPQTAIVSFKIKHSLGATATGYFKGFIGSVNFDPANLAAASIKASVDTKTVDTDNSIRDKIIKDKSYFDVEKFGKISMVSTRIEKGSADNEFIGYFNLTIKNTVKSVKLPFVFSQTADKATFKGSIQVNRIDYGIGEKSALLGDIATISITLNTQQ